MTTQTTHNDPAAQDPNDWPRCLRCGAYEPQHRRGWLGHKMKWPPLTDRERRALDRIEEALR